MRAPKKAIYKNQFLNCCQKKREHPKSGFLKIGNKSDEEKTESSKKIDF